MATTNDLIKKIILAFQENDEISFYKSVQEHIENEKQKNHLAIASSLSRLLKNKDQRKGGLSRLESYRFSSIPVDKESGFPLLSIKHFQNSIEDITLNEELTLKLKNIVNEFNKREILSSYRLKHKNKILLCGPPGTGKTFTAQVMSSVLELPFIQINFDSIISSFLGETASNLKKVFDFIDKNTFVVLFDEVDIIGKNRDDHHEHGEIKRVVNNFLQMLDRFEGESMIFCATNHQGLLDSALWRRFDDIILYPLPANKEREELLNQFLGSLERQNFSLEFFSKKMEGFSPSDIKMLCQNTIKKVLLSNRTKILKEDLDLTLTDFIKRKSI